jgi:hypothetical protein
VRGFNCGNGDEQCRREDSKTDQHLSYSLNTDCNVTPFKNLSARKERAFDENLRHHAAQNMSALDLDR